MANRIRRSWWRRAVLGGLAVLALVITPFVNVPTSAQAAPVVGFNAGNIISDSLFYDGNAMSTSEVQSFLNQQVPSCTIGTVDYKMPGSTLRTNNPVASKCLKDLRISTQSKAANAYCGSYVGAANETAAQIIYKVGKACGISQKVLLVMLEKEQSLVSDSWPTTRMFNYAMGWGCPDSGPGNTANCDSDGAGFAYQVYQSAWQYKVYQASPNRWNFKPNQNNTIQWHPNTGCGTSQVYIENSATAALYIYTPYRPNQAALNAGWGTGDSCSSYGNRNFYNFYNSWFGSTQGFTVSGDIGAYWNARGGASSIYGYPTGASYFYETRFSGGLWLQYFSGGIITTEMDTGKTVGLPFGPVFNHYSLQAGGIRGVLGAPLTEPASYTVSGGGVLQWFQGGIVITSVSSGTTANVAYGPVYDLYNGKLGGIYGELGYPVSSLNQYGDGQLQSFQNGVITLATGTSELSYVDGDLYDYYNNVAGGIYGRLGFPMRSEQVLENGTTRQEFKNGFLIRATNGTISEVSGEILNAYRRAESNGDPLGAPVGERIVFEVDGGGELVQFENGAVINSYAPNRTYAVSGGFFTHYNEALGGVNGSYGFPAGDATAYSANGGGKVQFFRNGMLFSSELADSVSGMLFSSPIYIRYNTVEGGIRGWLGYPVSDELIHADGSRSQQFQYGTITVSPGGVVNSFRAATAEAYLDSGGAEGPLGAQVGKPSYYSAGSGGWLTFFRGGIITEESTTGVAAALLYNDPLYLHYNSRAGGIYGSLGYPLGAAHTDETGALAQAFQGGVLRQASDGSVVAFTNGSLAKYMEYGAEAGALGEPESDSFGYSANGGGTVQFFGNGLIIGENAGGTTSALPYGPIYDYYNNVAGGIYGGLGYPTSDQVVEGETVSQQFQNGTLTLTGGTVVRS